MNEQEVNMLKRLTLVMVLVGVLLVPMTASAQTGSRLATVGVDDVTVAVGDTFTVPVWINGVSDLNAADVRLTYSNAILQGVSVERGTLLSPDYVVRQGFYTSLSTKELYARYAMTQINPTPPVTGSGVFMIVHFRALQPGTVNLGLRAELATRNGLLIPHIIQAGTVTVK